MLTVSALQVRYGGAVRALDGVSLQVPTGRVVALLGNNGAGKSTLLRTISQTLRAHRGAVTGGSVHWENRSLLGKDPAAIVRMGLVQVPEGRRIFGRLSVEENLRAGSVGSSAGKHAKAQARERIDELFPVLSQRRRQRAGLLSGGEQQMLAIARALMTTPTLLMLDEPSLGLAPQMVDRIAEAIGEINRQGTSILLVEQNANMGLALADAAYVLDVGTVSLSGPAAELAASDEVQRLYLGHAAGEESSIAEEAEAVARQGTLSRWSG